MKAIPAFHATRHPPPATRHHGGSGDRICALRTVIHWHHPPQ
ncbi:hypothetical protein [Comamonas terrigena]|nr:hypothetical protein [Comamonas terrigena]